VVTLTRLYDLYTGLYGLAFHVIGMQISPKDGDNKFWRTVLKDFVKRKEVLEYAKQIQPIEGDAGGAARSGDRKLLV